jgi:hypothetical protein
VSDAGAPPLRYGPVALGATKSTIWTTALSGQEVPKQVVKDTVVHGGVQGHADRCGDGRAYHVAAKGKAVAVVVPLWAPCKSGAKGAAMFTAAEPTAFKKHLLDATLIDIPDPLRFYEPGTVSEPVFSGPGAVPR